MRSAGFTLALAFLALIGAALANDGPRQAHAQSAEVMRSFNATYEIGADGVITVVEEITWLFPGVPDRHGIFRDLVTEQPCGAAAEPGVEPQVYPCTPGYRRVYRISDITTELRGPDGSFASTPKKVSDLESGLGKRIRIGDADKIVTGEQTYRITYSLTGALDAYASHDELSWNVTGDGWPVLMEEVRVVVHSAGAPVEQSACFQGFGGSQDECNLIDLSNGSGLAAGFESKRRLFPGEQLTIVVGWELGTFPIAPPELTRDLRVQDFFTLDGTEYGGAVGVGALSLAAVIALWWRKGRDRRYRSIHYLTGDTQEQIKPLFGAHPIVVEYTPPEELRPAQVGVLIDERADPLDVTATIVDLAVRGYLEITEIPKQGWFGDKDWKLTKLKDADDALLQYEVTILNGLFDFQAERNLSDLKLKFYDDLALAQKQLYKDAVQRGWFARKPTTSKDAWLFAGIGAVVLGVVVAAGSGFFFERALIGAPLIPAGVLLMLVSRAMARRTAQGSEALRRVEGFRLYVSTAETKQQRFNEEQGIFARYLPYAIVFNCVERWAKAFEGLEGTPATSASWYHGTSALSVVAFSGGFSGFSSSVASTITSAPKSSGSGFSGGGSSGGGGGGGGGGSW